MLRRWKRVLLCAAALVAAPAVDAQWGRPNVGSDGDAQSGTGFERRSS